MARFTLTPTMSRPHFRIVALPFLFAGALVAAALFIFLRTEEERARAYIEIGNVLVRAEVAASPEERRLGLSGRSALSENSGTLFIFDEAARHAIWMKDMRFPIDILWLREGRVAALRERVPPPSPGTADYLLPIYAPDVPADFVLEVSAGFVERHDIRVGHGVGIFLEEGTSLMPRAPDLQTLPGYEYFIKTLRQTPLTGKNFAIGEMLLDAGAYKQYVISYDSDGLGLSGIINIPSGPVPEGGFPTLILNHGLIYPEIYYSGRGSRREKDFFSRNGYVTIQPDYRGYGADTVHACRPTLSWTPQGCRHDFYAGYTRDVMNLLEALKNSYLPFVDMQRIGMWGHSMGGGIVARVAVLMPEEIKAYVLFAPISADAEDNFYELPDSEISRLAEFYGLGGKASEIYDLISPLEYFSDIRAPIQLHHGTADMDVPIEFSEKMYGALATLGKGVEFFVYPDQEHEFIEDWQVAAERALQFFDRYVKNAR